MLNSRNGLIVWLEIGPAAGIKITECLERLEVKGESGAEAEVCELEAAGGEGEGAGGPADQLPPVGTVPQAPHQVEYVGQRVGGQEPSRLSTAGGHQPTHVYCTVTVQFLLLFTICTVTIEIHF